MIPLSPRCLTATILGKTMSNIMLLNMDCMEYMETLPDKAFDLAIVDPPYGIKRDKGRA